MLSLVSYKHIRRSVSLTVHLVLVSFGQFWSLSQPWYSVCTEEEILDKCCTEFVFCGLSCFPFGCIFFLTLSTLGCGREMGSIVEKEGDLPVLTLTKKKISYLLKLSQVGADLPVAEGVVLS